jgi:hypothetical protein
MKKTKIFLILLSLLVLSMSAMYAQSTYTITGNGTQFNLLKDGTPIQNNQPLQSIIDIIQINSGGADCIIQFGTGGTDVLNLGASDGHNPLINFKGNWGKITLTGKATGSIDIYGTSAYGYITLANDFESVIESKANLYGSGTSGRVFRIRGGGTLNISGGYISSASNYTVVYATSANATINISGGSVIQTSPDGSNAVGNLSGIVNISGGTVSSNGSSVVTIVDGTINISGGTVIREDAKVDGVGILNIGKGTINISGGLVSATNFRAIEDQEEGIINISGGTVSATTGCAIGCRKGKITILGTAKVTSANPRGDRGTIYLPNYDDNTALRLVITGGTVENMATLGGCAIYNESKGAIEISGGMVNSIGGDAINTDQSIAINVSVNGIVSSSGNGKSAIYAKVGSIITVSGNGKILGTNNAFGIYLYGGVISVFGGLVSSVKKPAIFAPGDGPSISMNGGMILAKERYAIDNNNGTTTISGGIVFAYGKEEKDVIDGDYNQTGDAVIVAWNAEAGTTAYDAGTSVDIFKLPAPATAVWATQSDSGGISVLFNTTEGFIPIDSVTVTGVGVAETSLSNITVYPIPTTGMLKIEIADQVHNEIWAVDVFDVYGRSLLSQKSLLSSETTLNISHLPAGIYFVKISTEAGQVIKKVLKE